MFFGAVAVTFAGEGTHGTNKEPSSGRKVAAEWPTEGACVQKRIGSRGRLTAEDWIYDDPFISHTIANC